MKFLLQLHQHLLLYFKIPQPTLPLQGYAYDTGVSGASAKISFPYTDNKGIYPHRVYTAIFHLTPGLYTGATNQTIFERGTAANGGLIIEMDNGVIEVYVGGLTSPLISRTVSPRDGKLPMMVAVVFNADGEVPCKLYIDGKLEDYSMTAVTIPSEETAVTYMCNNAGDSQPYYGLMEEVIFYIGEVFFPSDSGEFILDGTRYVESVGAAPPTDSETLTQHAKLFIMDYHNIRGDGKDVQCSTPSISWRPTIT